ncbi:MAG: LysM protein [Paenibacillus sp.]|jgi:hypothetical protein|nr:LysM protein [Paenibacillus sp.]
MDRAFGYGGFGYSPYYYHFPRRRFFPFFFISPLFFPFFRGEEDRNAAYFAQHCCKDGDSMEGLAKLYNVPQPILEATNPHITNPDFLAPGSTVNIPRMDTMHCQKMYMEQQGTGMEEMPLMDSYSHMMSRAENPYVYPHVQYSKPKYPSYHPYPPNYQPEGDYPTGQGVGIHLGGHLGGHWAGVHAGGHLGNQGIGVHTGGHLGGYGAGVHAGGHLGNQGIGVHTGGHLGGYEAGVHAGGHLGSQGIGVHTGGHLGGYGAGVHAGGHFGGQGVGVHVGGNLGDHVGELGVHFGGTVGHGGNKTDDDTGKNNEQIQ